jgi:hypothetical protein
LWVENRSDELWIGVKGQSSSEIAGSPRNVLRYGLGSEFLLGGTDCQREVEHCMGEGPSRDTESKQTPNALLMDPGRQGLSDNVQSREGKNPDRRLRSRSAC